MPPFPPLPEASGPGNNVQSMLKQTNNHHLGLEGRPANLIAPLAVATACLAAITVCTDIRASLLLLLVEMCKSTAPYLHSKVVITTKVEESEQRGNDDNDVNLAVICWQNRNNNTFQN